MTALTGSIVMSVLILLLLLLLLTVVNYLVQNCFGIFRQLILFRRCYKLPV